MTRVELSEKLKNAEVKPQYYSLYGKLVNDAFIMEKIGETWNVYYFERGSKDMEQNFKSENEACEYIYNILKDEPSVKS